MRRTASPSRLLRLCQAAQLVVIAAFSLYVFGFISDRFKNQVDIEKNSIQPTIIHRELVIDVNGTTDKNEICAQNFLVEYRKLCLRTMLGPFANSSIQLVTNSVPDMPPLDQHTTSYLCPCVPSTLEGKTNISLYKKIGNLNENEINAGTVQHGGQWKPSSCVARQRVAIIIPFRNRDQHLLALLGVLHPLLQRQLLDYTIFVAEQAKPDLFNKAMLMNAGFHAASTLGDFDCFIFHDVDLYPLDDRNFYTCSPTPRHVAGFINKWGYRLFYAKMFGGAVAFRREHFLQVNGFSNSFFGWGGEDDDMYQRTRAQKLNLHERHPQCIAKYNIISHVRDKSNPSLHRGFRGWQYRPEVYSKDGLNSLYYLLAAVNRTSLYTKLVINLPPTPTDILESLRIERERQANATALGVTSSTTAKRQV